MNTKSTQTETLVPSRMICRNKWIVRKKKSICYGWSKGEQYLVQLDVWTRDLSIRPNTLVKSGLLVVLNDFKLRVLRWMAWTGQAHLDRQRHQTLYRHCHGYFKLPQVGLDNKKQPSHRDNVTSQITFIQHTNRGNLGQGR